MTISTALFDKVIIIRDSEKHITGIVIHDVESQTKEFYELKQMGMEEIQSLLNNGIAFSRVPPGQADVA